MPELARIGLFALLLPSLLLPALGCDIWVSRGEIDGLDLDGDGVPLSEDCDPTDPRILRDDQWFDGDADGHGDPAKGAGCSRIRGTPDVGTVDNAGDCDDLRADLNPGTEWYLDQDGDGWPRDGAPIVQCEQPADRALRRSAGDCDDDDETLYPEQRWHRDEDGDGFGREDDFVDSCLPVTGYRRAPPPDDARFDCDDEDARFHPETSWYRDEDGDGWGQDEVIESCEPVPPFSALEPGDCDDGKPLFGQTCPWVEVATGGGSKGSFSCGRRLDGTVACWGVDLLTADIPDSKFDAVIAGEAHACGLREGKLECWGSDGAIATPSADPSRPFVAATAGAGFTCGLRSDGTVACAGAVGTPESPAGGDHAELDAGRDHVCAILTDGGVSCWERGAGAPLPPEGAPGFVSVSVGGEATCAVRGAGGVECWGPAEFVGGVPPSADTSSVTVGLRHACATRDGRVECWSSALGPELLIPPNDPLRPFVPVDAGPDHTCGVRADGTLDCWGANEDGQASPPPRPRFRALSAAGNRACATIGDRTTCWGEPRETRLLRHAAVQVEAGGIHDDGSPVTCDLHRTGTAHCWGGGGNMPVKPHAAEGAPLTAISRRGLATCVAHASGAACLRESSLLSGTSVWLEFAMPYEIGPQVWSPPAALVAAGLLDVEVGWSAPSASPHGGVGVLPLCAVRADGAVGCGEPLDFFVGPGGESIQAFEEIAVGWVPDPTPDVFASYFACARSEHELKCWPEGLFPSLTLDAIAAGEGFLCAARPGLEGLGVACWAVEGYTAPVPTNDAELDYLKLAAGPAHVCGVHADGSIECFGADEQGQSSGVPAVDQPFVDVSAGAGHSCGLLADDTIVCWGSGSHGQTDPVAAYPNVAAAVGPYHVCLLSGDEVVCHGADDVGQATPPRDLRVDPDTPGLLTVGAAHSCAVEQETLGARCWGAVDAGQGRVPANLANTRFRTIDAGDRHNCAITMQDELVCWGSDEHGQSTVTPTPGYTYRQVSAGGGHSCALAAGGFAECWGENTFGQATVPEGVRFASIAAGADHTCGLVLAGPGAGLAHEVLCWGYDSARQTSHTPPHLYTEIAVGNEHSCAVRVSGDVDCWGRGVEGQTAAPETSDFP